MKTISIITRTHIERGSRRGGYVAGLARHNKAPAHAGSPTCSLKMSDKRECEKCGESMSLRDLIAHSRNCANGAQWFAMLPPISLSEERKIKRYFGHVK